MCEKHLIELKNEVINLLRCLPNPKFPTFSISGNSLYLQGDPLQEIWKQNNRWYWRMTERGELCFEKEFDDRIELVVEILKLYIIDMAISFELDNRIEGQDSRRLWFAYHDMLFTVLGEPYVSKARLFYTNSRYNGIFNDNL